jgi:hypothetical protein
MTEQAIPPTARERAAFDAATTGKPKDFIRVCRELGRAPSEMLEAFQSAPWRWLVSFAPGDPVTDEARHRPFQAPIQERLDLVREYLEAPWWRRVFSSPDNYDPVARRAYSRAKLPDR